MILRASLKLWSLQVAPFAFGCAVAEPRFESEYIEVKHSEVPNAFQHGKVAKAFVSCSNLLISTFFTNKEVLLSYVKPTQLLTLQ